MKPHDAWMPAATLPRVPSGWWRIADAARMVGVAEHVLRYWCDEFKGYIRTPRSKSNQRWFTLDDVDKFKRVRELLYVELYTIAGAKRQLRLAAEREKNTA